MRFNGMPERLVGDHLILVFTPDFFPPQKAFFFQVLNDPLNGALSDAYPVGHFTQHQSRFGVKHNHDMRVVGEKGPRLAVLGTAVTGA